MLSISCASMTYIRTAICLYLRTHSNPLGFNVQASSFISWRQLLIWTLPFIPRLFSLLGSLVNFFTTTLHSRSPLFLNITLNLSSVTFSLSSSTANVTFWHMFLRMSIYKMHISITIVLYICKPFVPFYPHLCLCFFYLYSLQAL